MNPDSICSLALFSEFSCSFWQFRVQTVAIAMNPTVRCTDNTSPYAHTRTPDVITTFGSGHDLFVCLRSLFVLVMSLLNVPSTPVSFYFLTTYCLTDATYCLTFTTSENSCATPFCGGPSGHLAIRSQTQRREQTRGARHGRSEDQRAYHQAKESLRRARKKITNLFLIDSRLKNPIAIGKLMQDGPKSLASTWMIGGVDYAYVATWSERARYEKAWTTSLNSQGNTTAPIQSRADYPEALANLGKMRKEAAEAGYKFNPVIRPDLQIRQRLGQSRPNRNDRSAFMKHGSGWFYWPQYSTSWSSSSTSQWSSTGWQERCVLFFWCERFRLQATAPRTLCTRNSFSRGSGPSYRRKIESQSQCEANSVSFKRIVCHSRASCSVALVIARSSTFLSSTIPSLSTFAISRGPTTT